MNTIDTFPAVCTPRRTTGQAGPAEIRLVLVLEWGQHGSETTKQFPRQLPNPDPGDGGRRPLHPRPIRFIPI